MFSNAKMKHETRKTVRVKITYAREIETELNKLKEFNKFMQANV